MNGKAQAGESESALCIVHLRSNLVYLQHPKQAFLEQKTFDLERGMKGFDLGNKGFDRGMKGFELGNKGLARQTGLRARKTLYLKRGKACFMGGTKGSELPSLLQRVQLALHELRIWMVWAQFLEANRIGFLPMLLGLGQVFLGFVDISHVAVADGHIRMFRPQFFEINRQ